MTDKPPLSLQLIGPMRIVASGETLSLPNRKTRALLAYLAQTARPHSRLSLSALFCHHSNDPGRALRWHLSMIRRHLGPQVILAAADTVQLDQHLIQVDAPRFAAALDGDLARWTLAQLAAALEMVRGEFLAGLSLPDAPEFELWLLGQRTHLLRLYERGLTHLVGHLIADQAYEPAVDWARQLVQTNPLLEEGHAALIWLYARLGQRQAALDQYAWCRALLQQELAVEPVPELAELVEGIRADRPLPPRPALSGSMHQPVPAVDFVGRQAELARLQAAWQAAQQGQATVILIEAEAGGGKSRLVQEIARPLPPGQALIGHCYESTQTLPGYPWSHILETHLSHRDLAALPAFWQAQLARLLPSLAGQLALIPAGLPADEREAERLFTAVAQTLFLDGSPQLIFLDDLQWADETSLRLFLFIARWLSRRVAPAVLIGAFRSEEAGDAPALAALIRDLQRDKLDHLRLAPLAETAVTHLISQFWPELPAADRPSVAALVTQATGGNPLFLTEVLRELAHTSHLPAALPVPAGLRDLAQRRLRQIPAGGQQVLETLAILDVPATLLEAQQISGRSQEETVTAVDLALRWQLLADRPDHRYDFSHALWRQAILSQVSTARRHLLHRRAAYTLAQAAALNPQSDLAGRIVRHAQSGQAFDLVWQWAPLAAERAWRLYAHASAMALYEAAIAAFAHLPPGPVVGPDTMTHRHVENLLAGVQLGSIVGRPLAGQEQSLQTARTLLAQQPDKRLEGLLFLSQATVMAAQAHYETAVTTALAGYEQFRHLDEPRLTARCLALAAEARLRLSQNPAAQSLFTEALALFQAAADVEGESRCRSGLAHAAVNLGQVEVALAQLGQALEVARRRHDTLAQARLSLSLAHAWTYYYDAERIMHFARHASALFEQVQYDLMAVRAQSYEGLAHRFTGDTAGATAVYERVLAAAQRHGDRWMEGWMAQALGRVAYQAGRVAAAERWFERARQCRQESGEAQNLVSDLLWLGRLRLAQKQPQQALALTTAALNQLKAEAGNYYVYESWDVYFGQAEALAALGRNAEATTLIERATQTLLAFAAQIPDGRRHAFLAARPLARLLAAHKSGRIPPYQL